MCTIEDYFIKISSCINPYTYNLQEFIDTYRFIKDFNKKSGIYIFYNNLNGKKYIGSSKDLRKRLNTHCTNLVSKNHTNKHFQNGVMSVSANNFTLYVYTCDLTRSELFDLEAKLIELFDSKRKGYNQVVDSRNMDFSEVERFKIGIRLHKSNKGVPKSEEHKKKCGESISKVNRKDGNPYAKMTTEKVLELRKNCTKYTIEELAKLYNIAKNTVSHIIHLRAWNYPECIPDNYIITKIKNPKNKFSKEDVLFIRSNYKSLGIKNLAKKYNVDRHVISNVVHYKTYKDYD